MYNACMAGYSAKPLITKLGIKEGWEILVINPPENYFSTLELPATVSILKEPKNNLEFIQIFVQNKQQLFRSLQAYQNFLSKSGSFWISWPKVSSGLKSDLAEDVIRDFGLQSGLVDVKVIAVDETYSGLKFVYRLTDR